MVIPTISLQKRNMKLRKLSLDFSKHISKDIAKSAIIPPKIILESLSLWPGHDSWALKILNWSVFFNLFFMGCGHLSYVFMNITDIPKMASACTTASTTIQTCCKISTLRFHKLRLNSILTTLWDDFWPASWASPRVQRRISSNMRFIKIFCFCYLGSAFSSCSQFMAYPLIFSTGDLPLASNYPFPYHQIPVYEILYVWQWFSNFIVVCVLSGFDFFMAVLMMNLVAQFQILQDVLRNLYPEVLKVTHLSGFSGGDVADSRKKKLFLECVKQHIRLLKFCEEMEKVFSPIIFLQFFMSTTALCVSSFVFTVDKTEAMNKMLLFCVAHILQLFIYCTTGNEVIYESSKVSEAAFHCGWHFNFDREIMKELVLIIQRSQKDTRVTALGFTELSYRSFVLVLRFSFSFYTLLDSITNKA